MAPLKVLVCGASQVGKSTLVKSYVERESSNGSGDSSNGSSAAADGVYQSSVLVPALAEFDVDIIDRPTVTGDAVSDVDGATCDAFVCV